MKKVKTVIFDLDNTLIDFMQMKKESCKAAVQAMISSGLQMSREEAYSRLLKTYFKVGIESNQAFTQFLLENNQFTHKILAAAINQYLETKSGLLESYPQVESTLIQLSEKGVLLGIVTDAPKTKAYQRLMKLGIEKYFRFVVGFEDTNSQKKTGLPLTLALELIRKQIPDIKNGEILMVGDSITRDLNPAKKLGMRTALAKYGQKEEEKGTSDYELESIDDLIKIV